MIFGLKKAKSEDEHLEAEMLLMGQNARQSARILSLATSEQKNNALKYSAQALRAQMQDVLKANLEDIQLATENGATKSYLDRLALDEKRIEAIAQGLEDVAALKDPVGDALARWEQPNGLKISRVRVPIGVIGVIFESRPNVTADAGSLCLKAGNACILRTGSDSFHSAMAIHQCLKIGLEQAGLPIEAIQLVQTKDRAAVGAMLRGLNGCIDVIVPRGGKSLVARVQEEARVPVFAHLEGIVHIYVHESADLNKAAKLVLNAKMRRVSICGAAETLLVDRAIASVALKSLVELLLDSGCEVRGDEQTQKVDARVKAAQEKDWSTEYLEAIISVKVVANLNEAIAHIEHYGSHHTDSIICEDATAAQTFFAQVDSAIVMHNASTQFADGGEFGFGAEIGIATGRMHARGPVGVEQLTTFKYTVEGDGQIRP